MRAPSTSFRRSCVCRAISTRRCAGLSAATSSSTGVRRRSRPGQGQRQRLRVGGIRRSVLHLRQLLDATGFHGIRVRQRRLRLGSAFTAARRRTLHEGGHRAHRLHGRRRRWRAEPAVQRLLELSARFRRTGSARGARRRRLRHPSAQRPTSCPALRPVRSIKTMSRGVPALTTSPPAMCWCMPMPSKGFKSGGYPILSASVGSQLTPVVQESVLAYELGTKAKLSSNLQVNGAIFLRRLSQQAAVRRVVTEFFGPLDALVNVPKSSIEGAEWQITYLPLRGLTLTTSGTYIESKIKDNFTNYDPFGNIGNFNGEAFPLTPKWQLSADSRVRLEPHRQAHLVCGYQCQLRKPHQRRLGRPADIGYRPVRAARPACGREKPTMAIGASGYGAATSPTGTIGRTRIMPEIPRYGSPACRQPSVYRPRGAIDPRFTVTAVPGLRRMNRKPAVPTRGRRLSLAAWLSASLGAFLSICASYAAHATNPHYFHRCDYGQRR